MFIPCTQGCVYQSDGCCRLGQAGTVNGEDSRICPHFMEYPDEIRLPTDERFIPREPRRLL
ncbi:MAG: hypothetical protein E7554_09300 [Ruminococcaceae bacterium]|nr:hypothetical protein [Oscillospiraceae bacterium]